MIKHRFLFNHLNILHGKKREREKERVRERERAINVEIEKVMKKFIRFPS